MSGGLLHLEGSSMNAGHAYIYIYIHMYHLCVCVCVHIYIYTHRHDYGYASIYLSSCACGLVTVFWAKSSQAEVPGQCARTRYYPWQFRLAGYAGIECIAS